MAWAKAKTAIVIGVSVLLAAGTTVVVVSKTAEPLPPIKSLPNPNGYDDLVKAGGIVSTNDINVITASREQLLVTTAANAEALALARTGLSKECRVPLQFSQSYSEKHLNDLAGMKRLAQAFITEGKMAELENRPDDAAKSYLDTVHLANESTRGGVLIDQLVGVAIESLGTSHLTNLVNKLDAKSCQETVKALESLDVQRQTWDEVMQQEKAWSQKTFTGIGYTIQRRMKKKSMDDLFASVKQKNQKSQKITRQLIIQFAARAYALDKGQPPAIIDVLVPDYLKAVPVDPVTGLNMVYSSK